MSTIVCVENLSPDTKLLDLRTFFGHELSIVPDGVHFCNLDQSADESTTAPSKASCQRAFVQFASEQAARQALGHSGRLIKGVSVRIAASSQEEMERALANRLKLTCLKRSLELVCEWVSCGERFTDRSLYLSHINRSHVRGTIGPDSDFSRTRCQWKGCYEDCEFVSLEHLQLHLSFHAFHNQLMSIGQRVINITSQCEAWSGQTPQLI